MAHTKSQKATKGNKDSVSKRLGVKIYGSQYAQVGNIIVRQKGNKFFAGEGARLGHDFTIYAVTDGMVQFSNKRGKKYVNVLPVGASK